MDGHGTVQIQYILTYGSHEFLNGYHAAHPMFAMHQVLSIILNKHQPEISAVNMKVGNRLNEMYNVFINRQDAIEITAMAMGGRSGRAVRLQKQDLLEAAIQDNMNCLRFHIDSLRQSTGEDYKKRILRFYNYYNPEKLVIVEKMLADARGFEEELLASLVEKYGAEPLPSVDLRFRDRLTAFYHHYNPERVPEVDAILLEYNGMEEQLFGALVAKYGPEPIILGSEADSDDSFTYTSDNTDKPQIDAYPLSVPLMPFIAPLHDYELPVEPEFSSDIHFWDNFVNQMPGEGEEAFSNGLDCNQELLQQFMKSYPILFPHILTVTCPFKEQVFRGSNEFWQYVKARGEANQSEVQKADASHVVRAVSSVDVSHPPVLLTRKEWQDLVLDWEAAHGLERRVKVGSVALDADPNAPPRLPPRPPPVAPPVPPPETTAQIVQTSQDTTTQTIEEAVPQPPEPAHHGRLTNVGGRALPVAWPISTLAKPTPVKEDSEPPLVGDATMEPYLRQALADAHRRKELPAASRTMPTQTGGWVPPPTNTTLTKAGPSPRRVKEEPAPTMREGMKPFAGFGGMSTVKVVPSQGASSQSGREYKDLDRNWGGSEATDDFMEITNPRKAMQQASVRRQSPQRPAYQQTFSPTPNRAVPTHRGPNPAPAFHYQNRPPTHSDTNPPSLPSSMLSPGQGESKDQYWKAFLQQMQSLTTS